MKSKIVLILAIVFIVLLFSGCTSNTTDNSIDDNSLDGNDNDYYNDSWLENYSPVHFVGTGSDDFWIDYPQVNPSSGETVEHLQWLTDPLESNCVLFVVHITGCEACQPQADRVIDLSERYEEHVFFFDLDASLGGSVEERAYDAYVYDPDGSPGYIALTGIFTLVNNSGNIEIGWHSWEKDVDYSELESWIRDAIYYYRINSEG